MPSKRSSPASRAYHHGDLRDSLVRSALALLRSEGPEALTLRAVARASGVSQAAPYRHFADRRALVAAVAEQGFIELETAMLAAVQGGQGRPGMRGVAFAYVAFGMENPALYRIMFGPEVARQGDLPELKQTSSRVLGFVRIGVEGLQQAQLVAPGDAGVLATVMWSMLHGLVMLALDGQTDEVGLPLDQLVAETTRIMMFGMAHRPQGPQAPPG